MGNWTSKIKNKLEELEGDLGHYVYEVAPIIENKKEVYQLASSTQSGLMNQVSMFLAMREYHENRDVLFSWKKFEEAFEKCFPEVQTKSAHWGTAQNPWGRSFDSRPKFKVFYPTSEQARNEGESKTLWLVEFWPNRDEKENSYLLVGNLNNVIQQAIQIMQTIKITENLNYVLGMPISEHLKKAPKIGLTIQIIFTNYEHPPWYKNHQRPDFIKREVTIPFVKPEAIKNYANVRAICGGGSGLEWGKERATAYVALNDNDFPSNLKGMPQVWCGGSTYDNAKKNAKRLLQLSNVKTISFNKSGKDGDEGVEKTRPASDKEKQSYKVYPAYFFIYNSRIVDAGYSNLATPARKILLGKLNKKSNNFRLDFLNEPYGYTEAITDLIRWNDV